MKWVSDISEAFFHLFYPHLCIGCGNHVIEVGNFLCLECITNLPHTGFALYADNPVENIFRGRIQVQAAMSELYFSKHTMVQHMLHDFKYQGNKQAGIWFGRMMGKSLQSSPRFQDVELLVPLPLFIAKEKKRGYNQSALLCEGIAEIMHLPVVKNNVTREINTATQTRKHRTERWQNVAGTFCVKDPSQLENRHILLVDDVVTTGATLEACGMEILRSENALLSIATLAMASR